LSNIQNFLDFFYFPYILLFVKDKSYLRGIFMNISDRNIIGGDPAAKNQNIADRVRTERTDITAAQETEKPQAGNLPVEVSREPMALDKYLTSDDRQKARELAGAISSTEEQPREDAVKRAQDRMQSGYYNSEEAIDRIANILVNTQKV
jgi:hypothetical protein